MSPAPKSSKLKKTDHVFLVDGSGYIFRAYHALPPLTRKSDGRVRREKRKCGCLWILTNDQCVRIDFKQSPEAIISDDITVTSR